MGSLLSGIPGRKNCGILILIRSERGFSMKRTVFFLLSALILSSPLFAARPLVTDDFGTVRMGKYEIEAGSYSSAPSAGGNTVGNAVLQAKYGLLGYLDVGVEMPYYFSLPVGFGDGTINAKFKIAEYGENSGLSLRVGIKLANADASSGLGTGHADYSVLAIYSREMSDFRTHYNIGYTLVGVPAGAAEANVISYSAAVEREVYPGADIVLECFGRSSSSTRSNVSAQIGGRWQVTRDYRVDTGYSVDFDNNSQDVATIGVTFTY